MPFSVVGGRLLRRVAPGNLSLEPALSSSLGSAKRLSNLQVGLPKRDGVCLAAFRDWNSATTTREPDRQGREDRSGRRPGSRSTDGARHPRSDKPGLSTPPGHAARPAPPSAPRQPPRELTGAAGQKTRGRSVSEAVLEPGGTVASTILCEPGHEALDNGATFQGLGLADQVQRRLQEERLTSPTPVQAVAIPHLLAGYDAAVQSYTGSGKTLAYLLPILSRVGPLQDARCREEGRDAEPADRGVAAVIVAPSRELAMQIVREAERFLGPQHRRVVQQLIGGANQRRQEEGLRQNKPLVVVGTPGRIADISRAGKLHTHGCRFLVLDEADSLFSQQFRLDMLRILEHVGRRRAEEGASPRVASSDGLPRRTERQLILVSATMPVQVLTAAARWGHQPLLLRASGRQELDGAVGGGSSPGSSPAGRAAVEGVLESLPPNLDHRYVVAEHRHKVDALRRCVHAADARAAIVFMNFSGRLKDTVFKLEARSMSAGCLHGDMDKVARANVLSAFRNGKLRVLVVSEVAARGLDVMECDLVVNLELPTDAAHYVHRAGRTGRLGRGGLVVTICEEREVFVLEKFASRLGLSIARSTLAEGRLDSSVV